MKAIKSTLFALAFVMPTMAQTFALSGKVDGRDTGKIYLINDNGDADSTQLKDGKFTFSGKTKDAEFFYLRLAGKEYIGTGLFLTPGKMTFETDVKNFRQSKITGNPYNDQWKEWSASWGKITAKAGPIYMRLDSVTQHGKVKETEEDRKIFNDGMKSLEALTEQEVTAFIKKYPSSPVSPFIIIDRYINYSNPEMEKKMVALVDAKGMKSYYGRKITDQQKIAKKTAIGAKPEFAMADTSGKVLKLSSLRGKYVLVDFWASWCGPCRKENPNVVKAYKEYHDKGFEIVGVSLDTQKEAWMKAVAKDGLTWNHVSDLKGWKSDLVKEYGIKGVPTSFLLDKDGKVVAKDLRGEALENKLKELMP